MILILIVLSSIKNVCTYREICVVPLLLNTKKLYELLWL